MRVPTFGQSLFEVTPYRIKVWFSLQVAPEIPARWSTSMKDDLARQAKVMVGAPWSVSVDLVPETSQNAAFAEKISTFEFLQANQEIEKDFDKFVALKVSAVPTGYRISARELDIATRIWSQTATKDVERSTDVLSASVDLLCDVFVPLVNIVSVNEKEVVAQVKAGALVPPKESPRRWNSPTRVNLGDVLLPYIRKMDRAGKVPEKGIEPVRYTVLLVREMTESVVTCDTFSGYSQPFNTRRSSRTQQLALVARSNQGSTTLRAHERKSPDKPLIGYEIFARRPGEDSSEYVGRTDWRGMVEIPKSDTTVRLLFIKSGTRVLAKLPVVPGLQKVVEVGLRNDEARLEAEGFLLGVQESLVDLVARREILAARINSRIENKKLDEAESLLNELRRLPTSENFENRVQQRKQLLSVSDAYAQDQIDRLFADTRDLFRQFLSPQKVRDLQDKLQQARAK